MVHITTRKAVKRLLKMTEPTGSMYKALLCICIICTGSVILSVNALKLYCTMDREQLLECAVVIADRSDLYQALLYYCDLRPLNLTGNNHKCSIDISVC